MSYGFTAHMKTFKRLHDKRKARMNYETLRCICPHVRCIFIIQSRQIFLIYLKDKNGKDFFILCTKFSQLNCNTKELWFFPNVKKMSWGHNFFTESFSKKEERKKHKRKKSHESHCTYIVCSGTKLVSTSHKQLLWDQETTAHYSVRREE